jgi:adenine deaminase
MFRQPLLALLVVAASVIDSTADAQSTADVLIRHATIVDVEHARLIADQAVVTSGDRILAVGADGEIARAW